MAVPTCIFGELLTSIIVSRLILNWYLGEGSPQVDVEYAIQSARFISEVAAGGTVTPSKTFGNLDAVEEIYNQDPPLPIHPKNPPFAFVRW